jgi:methylated-DNA-[protein]-cysteine S-methyltransferase
MKLYYDSFKHDKFGHIVLGVSEKGLRLIGFGRYSGLTYVLEHACMHGLEAEENADKTSTARQQLIEYLDGKRTAFDIDLDLDYLPVFKRKALGEASRIPFGRIITYGELARKAGSPKAARAAGQVMATNPIPIVIPCHRVVGHDGHLTGYSGGDGIDLKKRLLALEGVLTDGMKAILN